MKQMYLITGGAGFIGSHLIDLLLRDRVPETSIRLFLRASERPHRKGNFSIVTGDLTDFRTVKKAVEGTSVIYHLAGMSGFKGKTIDDFRRGNVLPTKNLLEAIKYKKIKKFVYFSTIAVYGLTTKIGDYITGDESLLHKYTEIYGQSKAEAEILLKQYAKQYKIPFTIIRPSSVYGPRDFGQLYALYKVIQHNQFFIIGDGKNKLDFVYVQDLVKGTRLAEKTRRKNSEYILASGNAPSLYTIVTSIAKSLGKNPTFFHLPTHIAYPLSYIAKFLGDCIGKKSPLFPSRVEVMTSSYVYDISKAKKELGYNPTVTFEQGARHTAKWYLQTHSL